MQYRAKVKELIKTLILKTKKQTAESVIQSLNNPLNKSRIPIIEIIIKTTNYLPQDVLLKERIYHILNDLFERPKCSACRINFPKFIDTTLGYRQFCSHKCSNPIIGKKLGQYSKDHSQELLEKRTKTNLKKYGVKNVSNIPEVNQFKRDAWKRKSEKEIQEIVDMRQETLLEKFGVTSPSKNQEIKNKIKKTNLERYGVTTYLNTDSCREKTIESIINNMPEIMNKRKKTNLEKYGEEHIFQSKDFLEKRKKEFFSTLLNSTRLKNHYVPNFNITEYNGTYEYYEWKCLKCNTIFPYKIINGQIPRCPTCYPIQYLSKNGEIPLVKFCKQYYDKIYENSRGLISPYEIDVFIPEIRLGIEFNGLYWHSELSGNKNPEYHQNKLLLALQNNIQLIQIFEDEYRDKQDIVESIILNKFGKNQDRIFARKCQIFSVYPEDARQFYFDNHIQGFVNGTHLGLFYDGKIVSMITFGVPRFDSTHETEIYRFCNRINTSVVGGLSKLVKAMISVTNTKSVVTYADARYGLGLGYARCGFKFVGTTSPGYYYMKHYNSRLSRNQSQKHMLKDKLKDFDPTLTEWENMQINGYDRIWDCGNFVYEMIL